MASRGQTKNRQTQRKSDAPYEPVLAAGISAPREDNPVVFLDVGSVDASKPSTAHALVGRLILELRKDLCPVAAHNFLMLVMGSLGTVGGIHYSYKNTRVHRVVRDEALQAGDLADSLGECSRSVYNDGGKFKDENFILRHVGVGVLSYCNTGPDSNGSIFQITLASAPWLDGKFVVLGGVVDQASMDTLSRINQFGRKMGDTIKELRIVDCGVLYPPPGET